MPERAARISTVGGTLCIYALASRWTGRITVRGVAGETLQAIHVGRIDAIVGRVRSVPKPTEENLRRYDRMMSALWRRTPALLPARFGTSVRDLADLQRIIRARDLTLRRSLRAVRNRAQMTVRMVTTTSDVIPATDSEHISGTHYLRARQREHDVPALAPLRTAVRRWIRDERMEKRGSVASIYHLIPAGSVERYRTALERAARDAGVRMIVSGPWPPYAFADTW